jgi:hypothetical protein
MERLWFRIVIACASAGASCNPDSIASGPARDASLVQTDSVVYTLRRDSGAWRTYALATYQNTDTVAVYFARCMPDDTLPMFTVRRTGADSSRELFVDWAWRCWGGVPTDSLLPGAALTVQVPFGSVDQPRMQPPMQLEWLVGRMRVELTLCRHFTWDSGSCDLLPQADRQSNAFDVRF